MDQAAAPMDPVAVRKPVVALVVEARQVDMGPMQREEAAVSAEHQERPAEQACRTAGPAIRLLLMA